MALKQGKKTVNLNTENLGLAPMPTTSITAQIAKPISDIINTFQKTAEADAKVNWQFQFDQSTRDHYLNLKDQFKSDPEGMRNAVDTYSKTVLANTPNAFKPIAQNILAGKNLANMNFASTNARNEDTRSALNGWEIKKVQFQEDLNTNLFEINQNVDASPIDFNNHIDEQLLTLNQNYGLGQESLVETGRMAQSQLTTDLDKDIKNLEILRVFNIMKNIDEVDAIKYLTQYANGVDKFALQSKNKENPIYKKYNNYLKDPFERSENVNKIKKLYQQHTTQNIFGTAKKPQPDLNELKEPGKPLSIEMFKGGAVDANVLAEDLGVELGSSVYKNLVKYVAKANNIQRVVAKSMQNPNKLINFNDENVTKEEWANAILANLDPPIHKIEFSNLQSDSFKTAINTMELQNYFPTQLRQALEINKAADYSEEPSLIKFAEKAKIYEYAKNLFPNEEYPSEYQKAIDAGVIDEIDNNNFTTATNILKNIDNDDYNIRLEAISKNENNTSKFKEFYNDNVASPNWIMEMFQGGKGELNENLFTAADQSTFFAYTPSNITPPIAYQQLETFFYESMANLTTKNNIDPWSDKNKNLRNQAWNIATRKLKQSGWGVEIHTSDGQPKLVKDPIWKTYPTINDNDYYHHVKKAYMTNENSEDLFGKNWNQMEETLNKYFDDKNNEDVKIEVLRQTYNDENGQPAYKLNIWDGDFVIPVEGNFKPAGWIDHTKAPIPGPAQGTMATLINDTTNEIYEQLSSNIEFGGKLFERSDRAKKILHSIIRNGLQLSDFRFYPDIPGINDQPKEIRPFAFLARQMGFEGEFRDIITELSVAAETANERLSLQKKIKMNRDFSNLEKLTESSLPPEKTIMSNNDMEISFKQYALDNYDNKNLKLTHRTNNWGAVSSDNWDGEIPLNYQNDSRKFAVFSKPKDSIRAAVKTILNHSMLTAALNKVDTRYGSNPTLEQIFNMYAKDSNSYLESLKQHTNFMPEDTIDLMDSNQMHKLLKFITQHEMGFKYFEEKFGNNNPYVNSVIFTGYEEAINSYNGELGKL